MALLHLEDVKTDLVLQGLGVLLQKGLSEAASARPAEIWVYDFKNGLEVLVAVVFKRTVLVFNVPSLPSALRQLLYLLLLATLALAATGLFLACDEQ